MSNEALNSIELGAALHDLPDWSGDTSGIRTTFVFTDFLSTISFMSEVAPAIEQANHHPEWSNVYNRLTVTLRTHDAGNKVTAKDIQIATLLTQAFAADSSS